LGIKRRVKEAVINLEIWPGGLTSVLRWLFGGGDHEDNREGREHSAVDPAGNKSDSEINKEEDHGKS